MLARPLVGGQKLLPLSGAKHPLEYTDTVLNFLLRCQRAGNIGSSHQRTKRVKREDTHRLDLCCQLLRSRRHIEHLAGEFRFLIHVDVVIQKTLQVRYKQHCFRFHR